MDDHARRVVEHFADERKVLRARLPQGIDARLDHRVAQQSSDQAGFALHRIEVRGGVAARKRDPGDEVVEDEVVQDDDAGPAAKRVDDPAVRIGVVADVVEG